MMTKKTRTLSRLSRKIVGIRFLILNYVNIVHEAVAVINTLIDDSLHLVKIVEIFPSLCKLVLFTIILALTVD